MRMPTPGRTSSTSRARGTKRQAFIPDRIDLETYANVGARQLRPRCLTLCQVAMKFAPAVLIVLTLVAAVPAAAPRPSVPLADVLERATEYVRGFVAEFSSVVAEERYVQDSHPAPDAGGFG